MKKQQYLEKMIKNIIFRNDMNINSIFTKLELAI